MIGKLWSNNLIKDVPVTSKKIANSKKLQARTIISPLNHLRDRSLEKDNKVSNRLDN